MPTKRISFLLDSATANRSTSLPLIFSLRGERTRSTGVALKVHDTLDEVWVMPPVASRTTPYTASPSATTAFLPSTLRLRWVAEAVESSTAGLPSLRLVPRVISVRQSLSGVPSALVSQWDRTRALELSPATEMSLQPVILKVACCLMVLPDPREYNRMLVLVPTNTPSSSTARHWPVWVMGETLSLVVAPMDSRLSCPPERAATRPPEEAMDSRAPLVFEPATERLLGLMEDGGRGKSSRDPFWVSPRARRLTCRGTSYAPSSPALPTLTVALPAATSGGMTKESWLTLCFFILSVAEEYWVPSEATRDSCPENMGSPSSRLMVTVSPTTRSRSPSTSSSPSPQAGRASDTAHTEKTIL